MHLVQLHLQVLAGESIIGHCGWHYYSTIKVSFNHFMNEYIISSRFQSLSTMKESLVINTTIPNNTLLPLHEGDGQILKYLCSPHQPRPQTHACAHILRCKPPMGVVHLLMCLLQLLENEGRQQIFTLTTRVSRQSPATILHDAYPTHMQLK